MSDDLARTADGLPRTADGTVLDPVDGWPVFGYLDENDELAAEGTPISRRRWNAMQAEKENAAVAEAIEAVAKSAGRRRSTPPDKETNE